MDSRYRSLYKVDVYETKVKLKGQFELLDDYGIDNLISIDYGNAVLINGISDLKGMVDIPVMNFNGQKLEFKPGTDDFNFKRFDQLNKSGLSTSVKLNKDIFNYEFYMTLNLRGSKSLSFVPLARQTNVSLKSSFPHPSFQGDFSNKSKINDSGFSVNWKISEFNRNLPFFWLDDKLDITNHTFGVNLKEPVNNYSKSERATKYMILVIVLIFLVFFITEIVNKLNIHIFQYTLIGVSLAVFFTLLLAISEYEGFDIAYLIASLSTIILIVLYSLSVFKNRNSTIILINALIGVFGFIYSIIQMEQYSLLSGAIGMFIVVGITMYTTRKVNWYEN